jgi:hypothetical protein
MDDLAILALMTTNPLMANAQLTANALFGMNELDSESNGDEAAGHSEAAAQLPEGEREESKRGLLDRLDDWFWNLEQRALEARLAEATDIYDLELRIREIERGTPWRSH